MQRENLDNLLIAKQKNFVISGTPGAGGKPRKWIMHRPINKIPITFVGHARRRLVKTIPPIERFEASGMSPERALIRSESAAENFMGILKIDRRKDWSSTLTRMREYSILIFIDGIKLHCTKLIETRTYIHEVSIVFKINFSYIYSSFKNRSLKDFKRNSNKYLYVPLHTYPRWIPCDIGAVQVYAFEFTFAFYVVHESAIESRVREEREREREMRIYRVLKNLPSTGSEIRSNFRFVTTDTRPRGIQSRYVLINVSPARSSLRYRFHVVISIVIN